MRPTQATMSSSEIKELMVTLPVSPKATKAMSPKFAKELSTSMHLAKSPAVYLLTAAETKSNVPKNQHIATIETLFRPE